MKNYKYLYLFLVCFVALSYWLVSFWMHPYQPLSSIIMYRAGDMDYFPLISRFSKLDFGEMQLFETRGKGIIFFPYASLFVHSLLFRFFHEWGYVIADVIIVIAYFIVLAKLFERLGISVFISRSVSLLIVSGAVEIISKVLLPFLTFGYISQFYVWGWRIPRPFVTDIFLLLGFNFILVILYSKQRLARMRIWVLLGVSFALLLQGDVYAAAMLAICIFLMILYFLIKFRESRAHIARNSLACFITSVIVGAPFIMQRLHDSSDVARRMGVFAVNRMKPIFLPGNKLELLAVLLFGLLLIFLFKRSYEKEDSGRKILSVLLLCVVCIVFYIALPVSCVVLGKAIQISHFQENLCRIISLVLIIFSLYFCEIMIMFFRNKFRQIDSQTIANVFKSVVIVIVICLSVLCAIKRSYGLSQKKTHMYDAFTKLACSVNYRNDFNMLIGELLKKDYNRCQVLGTIDWQVYNWWLAFKDGYSYFGSGMGTNASDVELETRFNSFCKLIGMPSEVFLSFLNRSYIHFLWVTADKYQVSAAYTFAPLSDYDQSVRSLINNGTVLDWCRLAIPNSEQKRFMEQYENFDDMHIKNNIPKLDLIVLPNEGYLMEFSPPPDMFVLTFKNSTFRVWVRKSVI